MADNKEKIYRLGGSDPRTGEERIAALLNRAAAKPVTQNKPRPKPGFGDPPEMSEEQKARIRKLRQQSLSNP